MTLPEKIRAQFASDGLALAEVAILQPADPFLDMAGEDLRRRIFLTESETGQTLCLRPEFTIPVCRDHIASLAGTPRRYSYCGEVFRQRREGRTEFWQAGIEDLGDADRASADARTVTHAHDLLANLVPGANLRITLGDQSVFDAVLEALGLPRGWQKRLARAFGSPDMLAAALADLANPPRKRNLGQPVSRMVNARDRNALAEHLQTRMEEAGLSEAGGRSADDIARRLIERAELGAVRLADEAMEALRTFLAIDVPLTEAPAHLEAFAERADLAIEHALEPFAARARAIAEHGVAEFVRYDAAFGRPLDYYTGLVFEITAEEGKPPLAGGGRYDRLLTMLGAADPIPGVGYSVWLDRIEAAGQPT